MPEQNSRKQKERDALIATAVVFLLVSLAIIAATVYKYSNIDGKQNSSQAWAAYPHPSNWPPLLNNVYPDLELLSINGKKARLSDYTGRVILIEPIGMSCPACQAFAGADKKGGFQGGSPQVGLPSMDSMLVKNGISPLDQRLLRVQLLLYSPSMRAPSLEEAQAWSKHFSFGSAANELILIGSQSYINDASYNMIPGFQLVDQRFVLRCDATGHNPKNDLYRELLPMLKSMLK